MNDYSPSNTWNQRLFTVMWVWICFRTILPWLVFFRLTFEGAGYSWGTQYFGKMFYSSGLARADFLVIYALLAASLFLLYHLRQYNFKLIAPVLVAYLGFFAADALYELLAGNPIIFEGDTLGVVINLSIPFFVLQFGMFILGVAWWLGIRNIASVAKPQPMAKYKQTIVKVCAAIVPVQLALLIFGEPHALTDEIGVILTVLQWLLLAFSLYPGSSYRTQA